jgi:hypothetical protein
MAGEWNGWWVVSKRIKSEDDAKCGCEEGIYLYKEQTGWDTAMDEEWGKATEAFLSTQRGAGIYAH